jgi:hypothetical protein
MGKVIVGVHVEQGQVEASCHWDKANVAELSLALAQIELMKEKLLREVKSLSTETEQKG